MSAKTITCLLIHCDGCQSPLDWTEDVGGASHFEDRIDAATEGLRQQWEMSTDGSAPDLCAHCVCERDGHVWSEPTRDGVWVFCTRCDVPSRVEGAAS